MDKNIKVGMADYKVASGEEVLITLGLGSCVGVVIYDSSKKIAGMAHIMLPSSLEIKNNSLSKCVLQFDLTGSFVKEYPSMQEVKRQLGISSSEISMCCNGKIKQSHGYIWKYKEVEDLQKTSN